MSETTARVEEAMNAAAAALQAGRLQEAQRLCGEVLGLEKNHAGALHLLGMVHHGTGDLGGAISCLERAVALEPDNVYLANDLGVAYAMAGRSDGAEACFRRAISTDPSMVEAITNLGNILSERGKNAEAEEFYRRALALNPKYIEAQVNLGVVLKETGRAAEAGEHYRLALAARPDLPQVHNNLGNVELELGNIAAAEHCFRRAIELDPRLAMAHANLGDALRQMGRLEEAEQSCRRALAIQPRFPQARSNLANVLKDQGRVAEAIQGYREALKLKPDLHSAATGLLLALNYVEGVSAREIYAEHVELARRFYPARRALPRSEARDPDRKLRIGYVSGDLRDHPVAQFLEPVLAHHDRDSFAVFCYYNYPTADSTTTRLKTYVDGWRDVLSLTDDALCQSIGKDAIDVLVDLSGHTAFNRLAVFARRAAPVQATWLGYLNTTGLEAMDYRISDRHATPESLDACHSERVMRLPDSQWCYQAPPDSPDVAALPMATKGYATFASFSNLAKISPGTIDVWSRILQRTPDSRLLLVRRGLDSVAKEYLARFARHGISPDRIDLMTSRPFREYLALHGEVDVVLDTFPYAGGTTTCHALWMGVPVVTLAGQTAASRGGASVLRTVGLADLVAETAEQYLEIALRLVLQPRKLADLRAGMRNAVSTSPLMDARRFTQNLEQAYRAMWRA